METAIVMLRHMLFLLIFLPIAFVVLTILTLLAIAWTRMYLHRAAVRRARQETYEETHDAQGRLLPPVSRGICQTCGRYRRRIYYLPDGSRVCEACYTPIKEYVKQDKGVK